jgi:aldose 1-epimerase
MNSAARAAPALTEITNGRLTARLIPFGASLVDLRLESVDRPLILGLADLADYPRHGLLFGAVVGRHANRIGNARVEIEGERYALEANEPPHHLHGGANGFAVRDWRLKWTSAAAAVFELFSPDDDAGFRGNLTVTAIYRILPPATLSLTLEAATDQTTIVNLCHHPYFNLDGRPDVSTHELTIAADRYLPSGPDLLPTGEIAAVAGTRFDFREPHRLTNVPRAAGETFNHNYCLADAPRPDPVFGARLHAAELTMELWTTQPGLHFYEGYRIANCPTGLDGRHYGPRAGLCLEAQNWPDSPNHADFPSAILPAGALYRQVTEYRFSPAPNGSWVN